MGKLKAMYDNLFSHISFDEKLIKKIRDFVNQFIGKTDDTVMFFGSTLIGYYKVVWNYSDTDYWWDEIFEQDSEQVRHHLHRVPAITPKYKISSDEFNNTIVYFIHRVKTSDKLTEEQKQTGCTLLMFSLNCKFLCSLLSHYFPYPTQYEVALKTSESMSMRYDLRATGSWAKMLKERSASFTANDALFHKTFYFYDDDKMVVRLLNDAQGRIRDTVKDITSLYYATKEKEARVYSQTATLEIEGELFLKDLTREIPNYIRIVQRSLLDYGSFVKHNLNMILYPMILSLDIEIYETLQQSLVEDYTKPKMRKEIDQFIEDILTYSLQTIDEFNIPHTDLSAVLTRLKSIYISGRVTDKTLIKTRKFLDKYARKKIPSLNNTHIVAERTGICLYIVLRALADKSL